MIEERHVKLDNGVDAYIVSVDGVDKNVSINACGSGYQYIPTKVTVFLGEHNFVNAQINFLDRHGFSIFAEKVNI